MMEKLIEPRKERFDIKETCDIRVDAECIALKNLNCLNLNCWNLNCWNLDCRDLNCKNLDCWNLNCRDLDCKNLDCWNVVFVHGNILNVRETIKAKVLIVYTDCKITGKIDKHTKVVKLKRE